MKYTPTFILLLLLIVSCKQEEAKSEFSTVLYNQEDWMVEVVTPKIANTIGLEEKESAFLSFNNKIEKEISASVTGFIKDYDGNKVSVEKEINVGGKASEKMFFPSEIFQKKGIKWGELYLKTAEKTDTLRFSLAYIDPIDNEYASNFKFGIAGIRYDELEELPELYSIAKQVGVQYERKYARWHEIQPDPNTWKWEKLDGELAAMHDKGIKRELLLTGTPGWAAAENYKDRKKKSNVPPNLKYWQIYVDSIANRYKDTIQYYEIWNEPDFGFFIGNTPEYLGVLETAYKTIKKVDPNLKVLSGGFASTYPRPQFFQERGDLHRDAIRLGQEYFDIHAVHIHGLFDSFKHQVEGNLKEIRDQLNTPKPLWFNETAMHSTFIGEKEQGKVLFKKMTFAMSRDAMGYCWFSLKNNDAYPKDHHEANYGMVTANNNPKAVYAVYNQMVHRMHTLEYNKDVDLGEGFEAYLFKGKDEYQLNAWKEEPALTDQLARFKVSENTEVIVEDLMGNAKKYNTENGIATVPITSDGSFIRFKNATEAPEVLPAKLFFKKGLLVTKDASVEIPTGNIEKNEDLTFTVSSEGRSLTTQKLDNGNLLVSVPKEAKKLSMQVEGKELDEEMTIPLTYPLFASNKMEESNPTIVLDQYGDVKNKYEHDPNTSHLTWKGAEDLSAKAWLGVEGDNLILNYTVTDDAHVQKDTGILQYKGDGIQFAITTRQMMNYWEIGYALTEEGKVDVTAWSAPSGFSLDAIENIQLSVKREGNKTIYTSKIPLKEFGLENIQENGFLFSFVVNDNDGEKREGWLQLSEGLAGSKDPNNFKYVVFQ
ncbi:hypothetical protein [Galbibacter mesophilus]|uniref:hypothetical protein n=1 Tax=Galbibacter mesophilus TaxID=379069 RepID=UPI00191FD8C4|nr:hypothetical protein [Galbibacter mesophilus]MCM5663888.1 hypothetical protein [Galbibacter mesophilus]